MRKAAIILAAGKGTRLRSILPKALHPICGKPMLGYLVERARVAGCEKIVVVGGYKIELVREYLKSLGLGASLVCVEQKEQLGSGHAVQQAARALKNFQGAVFVFYCDTPLISQATVKELFKNYSSEKTDCTLLSVELKQPFGYGRVQRGPSAEVVKIIEENDATSDEKNIREINVGCYVFSAVRLFEGLKKIKKNPQKKEYYLTDIVEIFSQSGKVGAVITADAKEVLGVNSQKDLARVEEIAQKRILDGWMDKGVRIRCPKTVTIDADVRIGQDTTVMPHTVLEQGSVIGRGCKLGPFARIRGNSRVGNHVVVGNFVELVRTTLGDHTQVKHLSYLGDASVGAYVNIGAGTITANYDGKNKHQTVIRDRASVGSGTILVAPVVVGRAAVTGAGAVVTRRNNVPDRALVVGVPARIITKRHLKRHPRNL